MGFFGGGFWGAFFGGILNLGLLGGLFLLSLPDGNPAGTLLLLNSTLFYSILSLLPFFNLFLKFALLFMVLYLSILLSFDSLGRFSSLFGDYGLEGFVHKGELHDY